MKRTTITTSMAKEMTELRELGVPILRIARKFDVSPETVYRHTSAEDEATIKAYQRRRYERERADPEIVERRKAYEQERARRRRKRLPAE